ncbi:DNA primase [Burkholderia anthina]|uniref:LPD7 domain-containing protein n=1 Tax=Burkholderia anthina TaxID=179879 RepID=UPI00158EA27A|nr:LPD7 domain-containing protein [Burkholderia anthina]MBY4867730.1 DNA primase [Burkholderia anthina]
MAHTTPTHEADPGINVIEQDVPGSSSGPAPPDDYRDRLESAAMNAVSARRRHEFDAARARLREQATRDDAATSRQAVNRSRAEATADADPGRAPLDQPPERVRKRYLRAGNQYFLKDAPYQLAFEDLGPYLVTEHNRPDVVESMIDMVQAKSWPRIRVSGHTTFRSEVWLQGTLLGIEVSGYEPKAVDLARLAGARNARLNNRIEVAAEAVATAAAGTQGCAEDRAVASSVAGVEGDAAVSGTFPPAPVHVPASEAPTPEASQNAANEAADAPRWYVGELREHGGAPYQHNPARSESYYVVFRDEAGIDQVVWGVDLERALREANAQIGQQVTLENLGKRFVTVRTPILDDDGKVIGEEEKDVYRNTWQVEVMQRDCGAPVLPKSDGPPDGEARSADSHGPPCVGSQSNHPRGTQYPESARALHLAVLAAAMREQGFSERSVARVRQRAERMLVAFTREGIPVPVPRVFDPSAPSGRDRRKRSVPDRTPAREIDRTRAEPSPSSPSR